MPVDEMFDQQQVVMKPLQGQLEKIRGSFGCALLASGEVAIVLDCERLAEGGVSAMAEAALDEKFGDPGYERIRTWLNDRCGIYYAEKKKELLSQRLARVLERFDIGNLDDLALCLETGQNDDIELAVDDAASTNHTYFFREPQVLDFFANSNRAGVGAQGEAAHLERGERRPETKPTRWRCWPRRLWGREQAASCVSILGTDISAPVIKHAESAVYGMPAS